MKEEKRIRLNKALRELNISLDRAVEHLSKNGHEIEAKPTTTITNEEYKVLLDGFKTDTEKRALSKLIEENKKINRENKILRDFEFNSYKTLIERIKKSPIDFENVFSSIPKFTITTKKTNFKNLNESYKKDQLVLVIGAGVSIEFGVPTWSNLLQLLMVHTIEKDSNSPDVLSKLFNDIFTPNPLISGRYLQRYFEQNNSSFEKMVREVLYSKINKEKESDLFNEIIKLCVAPGKSPNLNSIITYNFDDILEYKLNKTGLEIPYKTIHGIGVDIKNGELPIYHVHGFLPETGKLNDSNKITFGENNYHEQYTNIYSWNNIVQINKFRDNTCLFIGSSLTDPNIRRLLDIAYEQKGNKKNVHYIIKKRINRGDIIKEIKSFEFDDELINNEKKIENVISSLIKLYERFEENDSASFGVQTIWVEEWEEIPDILKKIRESIV
ncbi:SIR2 family protein [Tenacibaculum sp. Ill]|uniref:SIR2 family protein n=1 Tax=Tenacibaculum sp. Ill TaxID=3445935 RepID=UPI003F7AA320